MPHSARSLPPSKRHSRLTIVRRGCKTVTIRRDSWRSHVHRTRLRSACSSSSCKLPMSGVERPSPRVLLGDLKGDILFCEREYPPLPAPLRVRRDSRFVLTNNFSHGMLSAIKAARKKPFLFTRSREGTAGASPCGTEKAALLSRAAEMPRRSLRYKGTKCPASSGEFRWNHGQ